MAQLTSLRSTCIRRKVGCTLIDSEGCILSIGFNGVAKGELHCNEGHPCKGALSPSGKNIDDCLSIHAETNALLQCPDISRLNTCYVTCSPCIQCVRLLLNTPCMTIYFIEDYPHENAKTLWKNSGRAWVKINQI